jgi:hypothetical protein
MGAQPPAPRLDLVVGALNGDKARFVVIGGFAVIAHRAEHLSAVTDGGLVDLVREGAPPLDFHTVAERD